MDQTYKDSKVLGYAPQQLYDLVRDVDQYRNFLPMTVRSRVVTPPRLAADGAKEVMYAELAVGFAGLEESYLSEVSCWKPHKVEAKAADTSLFRTMKTTWTFEPAGKERDPSQAPALVSFDISFAFNNPVHAATTKAFFDRVSKDIMTAFEKRCRQVYGPPQPL